VLTTFPLNIFLKRYYFMNIVLITYTNLKPNATDPFRKIRRGFFMMLFCSSLVMSVLTFTIDFKAEWMAIVFGISEGLKITTGFVIVFMNISFGELVLYFLL
jgi:hypothetical protein